jgi:hypothetical protein
MPTCAPRGCRRAVRGRPAAPQRARAAARQQAAGLPRRGSQAQSCTAPATCPPTHQAASAVGGSDAALCSGLGERHCPVAQHACSGLRLDAKVRRTRQLGAPLAAKRLRTCVCGARGAPCRRGCRPCSDPPRSPEGPRRRRSAGPRRARRRCRARAPRRRRPSGGAGPAGCQRTRRRRPACLRRPGYGVSRRLRHPRGPACGLRCGHCLALHGGPMQAHGQCRSCALSWRPSGAAATGALRPCARAGRGCCWRARHARRTAHAALVLAEPARA